MNLIEVSAVSQAADIGSLGKDQREKSMAIDFGTISTILSYLCNATVFQQIKYIAQANNYVQQLKNDMERLSNRRKDVEERISLAVRDQKHQRTHVVQGWLDDVKDFESKVDVIVDDYDRISRCIGTCSADVFSMCSVGKRASDGLTDLNKLIVDGVFDVVAQPLPPPVGQELPGTSDLVGAKSNLEKILSYLSSTDEQISRIGIYGMGGAGKTKLLKSVNNELCRSIEIDHVIWVVVSREFLIKELQGQIAKYLRMELDEQATEASRANSIFNFLGKKKFVLLLDDVWEFLDLEKLGIPDGSKVIFTTRSEDVCASMNAQKRLKVEPLNQAESWELFKANLGKGFIESASPIILDIANQVAGECGGLPLALIVIGKCMSTKRSQGACQDLLTSIKKSKVKNLGIEDGLYHILKHSYDCLQDDKMRRCFLFCALFPEDKTLDKAEFIEYWFYHGIIDIEEYDDIGEALDYAYFIFDSLVSACLLEEVVYVSFGRDVNFVKMHDVIRDMALWIARDYGQNELKWLVYEGQRYEPVKRASDWERIERLALFKTDIQQLFVPSAICSRLLMLMLRKCYRLTSIPANCFNFFPALSSLDLSGTSIKNLPDDISALSELQYLNLSQTEIESLCSSLGLLRKLKFLILRSTIELKHIPHGLLSQFQNLQVLDLHESKFTLAESSSGIDHQSSPQMDLEELACLQNTLISLSLAIKTTSALETLGKLFAEETRELIIRKLKGTNSLNLANFTAPAGGKNITALKIVFCVELTELLMRGEQLRRLQKLELLWLPELAGIFLQEGGSQSILLPSLRRVEICGCSKLKDASWVLQLPSLEELRIRNCEQMQEIIVCGDQKKQIKQGVGGGSKEAEEEAFLVLPALCILLLDGLPQLRSIYGGGSSNVTIHCPSLELVLVPGCPLLKKLPFDFQRRDINHGPITMWCEEELWKNLDDDENKSYFRRTEFLPDWCEEDWWNRH